MTARYTRQQGVNGWDQQQLQRAAIAIAGSGPTAFLSGLMAAAMGFGRIVLLTHAEWSLPSLQAGADGWAEFLRSVNPDVCVSVHPVQLSERTLGRLPNVAGLIVAGNDLEALAAGRKLASKMPVVVGGAAGCVGIWGAPKLDRLVAGLQGKEENPLLAQVVAGLLVEEMRRCVMPLPDETGRAQRRNAFRLPAVQERSAQPSLALVGAGALGTWFGVGLGLSGIGVELSLYDDDTVDESNLNRQVLFYDAVGQHKAPVLAKRLHEWFPQLQTRGYGQRIEARSAEQLSRAKALVACADSFSARALLNKLARVTRRPLFNGGTAVMGGSSMLYVPGKTACLGCRMDVDRLAEEERGPQSCGQVAEASVVTSNAIVGALMAWTLKGWAGDGVERGVWEYDGRSKEGRIGRRSERPACACHRN